VTWRRRSRDHSTPHTPFPIGAPLWPSVYLYGFRDIRYLHSNTGWIVIAHARYHVTCTPMQNLGTYFNFSPPHCLFTMTLYWALMKNKGCLLTPNIKCKIDRKLSKSKNLRNFGLLWGLVVRRCKNNRLLVQKAHLCVNTRRLSHFAWRSVGGSDHQGGAGKKVRKSQRLPYRKDVSPLTQGLNCRSACDVWNDYTRRISCNIKKTSAL